MIKILISGLAFSMLLAACTTDKKQSESQQSTQEVLIWQDDFNGESLDQNKWSPVIGDGCPSNCGFGNNELQYYSDDSKNLEVSNGTLKIRALIDSTKEKGYSSAKLITKSKGDWTYGRIEVNAKLPEGRGTWPAIWMLPTLDRRMEWPLDGEIDIMEHVGYNQGMVYGTIHSKKYNHIIGTQKSDSLFIEDISQQFHLYGFNWNDSSMTWSIDGKDYLTLNKEKENYEGWPFDQNFHLILNLAVGGNWGGKFGVDESIWPQTFEIDYVKVYQQQ